MKRIKDALGGGEYKNVGYLKTLSLHRILNWIPSKRIYELRGFKQFQRDRHKKSTSLDYARVQQTEEQRVEINYNITRHGGFNKKATRKLLSKYGDGIAVCERLAYKVDGPIDDFNHKGDLIGIMTPYTIHSDSTETNDSKFIRELKSLNEKEFKEYGFKLGTLDLTEITPKQTWSLKGRKYLDATLFDAKMIHRLLKPLDSHSPKSVRSYHLTKSNEWEMTSW